MSEEEVINVDQSSVNLDEDTAKRSLTVEPDGGTLVPPKAGEDAGAPKDTGGTPVPPAKTQGVRAGRADGGRRMLERAARAAAKTGKRGDVHAYMRIRRSYV